jgi:hypothetical protein
MRPRRDKPLFRILGITLGLAFTAVGVITVHGALTETGLHAPGRVLAYGITTILAGICSTGFALFETRLDQVFCAPPNRKF